MVLGGFCMTPPRSLPWMTLRRLGQGGLACGSSSLEWQSLRRLCQGGLACGCSSLLPLRLPLPSLLRLTIAPAPLLPLPWTSVRRLGRTSLGPLGRGSSSLLLHLWPGELGAGPVG